MDRILLLLEQKKNRDLLTAWLGTRYKVVLPDDEQSLNVPFDLCLIDGPMLDRTWKLVQTRKKLEQPVFLPFVLITLRKDVDMVTRHLWQTTDELILAPIEKVELQARVEVLLRARRLSLDLKLRNEDLESYIHAITHDLRAPLRAIAGFAEVLVEDEGAFLSQKGQHYLATIQEATRQTQDLIDALIGFSRLECERIQLREVDLRLICEKCLHALEQEIHDQHAHVMLTGEFPSVWANPTLLKIALTNLLSNACKFAAVGVQPRVILCAQVREGVCNIEVQDNGIGIAPDDQTRLFTPFVQLHGVEEYPGIGLGLATVRKAVTLMGGRVGVHSSLGQGSTFWIELQASREVHHALSAH